MKIEADILVAKRVTIEVPPKFEPFVRAWLKGDDERTDKDWDLVESHTFEEMFSKVLKEEVNDVEIYDYTL